MSTSNANNNNNNNNSNNNNMVRKACGPCIALKAKCDHARPCTRCVAKGAASACVDVDRKSRPKKQKLSHAHISEEDVKQIHVLTQLLKQNPMTPLQLLQNNLQLNSSSSPSLTPAPTLTPAQTSFTSSHLSPISVSSNLPTTLSSPTSTSVSRNPQISQNLQMPHSSQNLQFTNLPNTPTAQNPQISQLPQITQAQKFSNPTIPDLQAENIFSQNFLSQDPQFSYTSESPQLFQNAQPAQLSQPTQLSQPAQLSQSPQFSQPLQPSQFSQPLQPSQPSQFSQSSQSPPLSELSQLSQHFLTTPQISTQVTSQKIENESDLMSLPEELLATTMKSSLGIDSLNFMIEPTIPSAQTNPPNPLHNLYANLAAGLLSVGAPSQFSNDESINSADNKNELPQSIDSAGSSNAKLVTQKLTQIRSMIDKFLRDAENQAKPKETKNAPVAIVDPRTASFIECNQAFSRLVGQDSEALRALPLYALVPPFARKIVRRDIRFFLANGITFGERFVAMRHTSGGYVYCHASFQLIGKEHIVFTITETFEDMPPCLKVTYEHYLGLRSVYAPPHHCDIPYCNCKMIHMPFSPEDLTM